MFEQTAARAPARRWYALCVAYLAIPPELRRDLAPQTHATYCRIRHLPRAWGEALDLRGAPLAVMRWVAWAPDRGERERRYHAALASWDEEGTWPKAHRRSDPPPAGNDRVGESREEG